MFSVCFVFVLVGLSWLALQQAFSSLCMSQTGCGMPLVEWKNPPGVERKGEGGGYCVWVTVGRRRSRSLQIAYWKRGRSGALDGGGLHRVLWGHSLLSSHSQLLGLGWVGGREQKHSHDVRSSSMLDLELNEDNEVDPPEYSRVERSSGAGQHEWMSLKEGTSAKPQWCECTMFLQTEGLDFNLYWQ